MGQGTFNLGSGFNKVDRVVVVFFNTSSNGENIRVKDNVFWRKAHLVDQHVISAGTDLYFTGFGVGLADFVKGHHNGRGAVTFHQCGLLDKLLFALFKRNRVNDALTLNTF